MAASFVAVVQRATAQTIDLDGLALFFAGVVAAYSLDRVLDPRDRPGPPWLRRVLIAVGTAASVACVVFALRMSPRTALLVPLFGAVVFGYPLLKRVPAFKTVIVSIAWTWTAIAFPFPDGSWLGWTSWSVPVALPLLLIVAGGCLLCDLHDAESDRSRSVASVPARAGQRAAIRLAMLLAILGAAIALVQHRHGLAAAGLGLSIAALCPDALARDTLGPLTVDMILTIPGVLIALHLV